MEESYSGHYPNLEITGYTLNQTWENSPNRTIKK